MIDSDVNGAIDGGGGNIGNWGEVKAQAAQMLGIALDDQDVFNVPLLATDPYGHFDARPRQATRRRSLTRSGLVEGNVGAPVAVPANAVQNGHAFLDDIAHRADPFGDADNDLSRRQRH